MVVRTSARASSRMPWISTSRACKRLAGRRRPAAASPICAGPRHHVRRRRARRGGALEPVLERPIRRGLRSRPHLPLVHRVEQHRAGREQVEHEHQHADQQHQRLQRNLPVGAHQQRLARLVDRRGRQVALHLALVGAEVGAEQEQRGDGARPERVLLGEVEGEVERLQAARGARERQRLRPARRRRAGPAPARRPPPAGRRRSAPSASRRSRSPPARRRTSCRPRSAGR